ncbi:molecular chaperone [Serratia quinivorans]|uniref:fimbrial biogenesis chaperone n=1 Tax=Serratia quinivorans TaxID=137545 RepID=UPI002E7698A8|nr:molecular chaperone [Serratia quinivorans]
MRHPLVLALVLMAVSLQGMAAGVGFNRSRLVYLQGSSSEAITAKNGTEQLYLLQSGVLTTPDGKEAGPFWVTPPIARLEANSQNTLRIAGKAAQLAALPQDRESVFYFFSTAIPAQPDSLQAGGAKLSIGLRTVLKLFYRPKGLPGNVDEVVAQLQVSRQGKSVVIRNPTPYYASLATLVLDGKPIDLSTQPSMIAPFSELAFPGEGRQARWRLMTDYGGVTDEKEARLSE